MQEREREKFRRIQIPINEDADVGGRIKKTAIFHVCVCVCVCSPPFAYQRDRSLPPVLMIQPPRISHVSSFLRDPLFLFEHPRKHNNKQRLRQANNNSINPPPSYIPPRTLLLPSLTLYGGHHYCTRFSPVADRFHPEVLNTISRRTR
jgi:hypothetical protein